MTFGLFVRLYWLVHTAHKERIHQKKKGRSQFNMLTRSVLKSWIFQFKKKRVLKAGVYPHTHLFQWL